MKYLFALLSAALAGCASTPTYILGDQHNSAYHYTYSDSATSPSVVSRTKCTMYVQPEVEKVPPTPLKEYAQIKPGEYERRIDLLLKHIEELRLYIASTRKLHSEAFKRYDLNCTAE